MDVLDRRSDRPPYRQIADHLRADIEEGRLGPGDRLPSEREIAEHYGVERATAHRAVMELHIGGYVISHRGRGVFVREPVQRHRLLRNPHPVPSLTDEDPAPRAVRPGEKVGSFEPEPAPDEVAESLGLKPGEELMAYRWAVADTEYNLLMLGATFFAPTVTERLPRLGDDEAGLADGSYLALQEQGFVLRHEDLVTARMPRPNEVHRMDLDSGIPLIVVQRITTDDRTGDGLVFQKIILPASRNELSYVL